MQNSESTQTATPTLVFVYNARSGIISMLRDAVHKTVSPQTYPCKLCDITYSPVRMHSQWKRFIKDLPFAVEFSYANLMEKQFGLVDTPYPAAFLRTDQTLTPWLTATQINAAATLEDLMNLVRKHLPLDSNTASESAHPQH